jgi:hypothetical protein
MQRDAEIAPLKHDLPLRLSRRRSVPCRTAHPGRACDMRLPRCRMCRFLCPYIPSCKRSASQSPSIEFCVRPPPARVSRQRSGRTAARPTVGLHHAGTSQALQRADPVFDPAA